MNHLALSESGSSPRYSLRKFSQFPFCDVSPVRPFAAAFSADDLDARRSKVETSASFLPIRRWSGLRKSSAK